MSNKESNILKVGDAVLVPVGEKISSEYQQVEVSLIDTEGNGYYKTMNRYKKIDNYQLIGQYQHKTNWLGFITTTIIPLTDKKQ